MISRRASTELQGKATSVGGKQGVEVEPEQGFIHAILIEVRAIIQQTWTQITRITEYTAFCWEERALSGVANRFQTDLGYKMFESGEGDESLRNRVEALDDQILSLRAAKGSTKALEIERRGLMIRIAETALATNLPPSGLPEEYQAALAARLALASHVTQKRRLKDNLIPEGIARRRVAIGCATPICLLLLALTPLVVNSNTHEPALHDGPIIPSSNGNPPPLVDLHNQTEISTKLTQESAQDGIEATAQVEVPERTETTTSVGKTAAPTNALVGDPTPANQDSRATLSVPDSGHSDASSDFGQLHYPAVVSRFDITTPDDLYYAHLVNRLVGGEDLAKWPLLKSAHKQLGSIVGDALDATTIANTITTSLPVRGDAPLREIDELVADCARILGIPKPTVFVRQSPNPQAYASNVTEPHFVVLTSGLLDLYKDDHRELRFVIGHELGHIKCDHMRMKAVGTALLIGLHGINEKAFGDLDVLPPLGLGRFCTWSREAEIAADRAGLLCCQDPQTAYDALARLLHGIPKGSSWIDPNNPNFDADKIISDFRDWESRPFVEFLIELQRYSATHPFIPQRLAALKAWYESGAMDQILQRKNDVHHEVTAKLQHLMVRGLASGDDLVDPYIKFIHRGRVIAVTSVKKSVQEHIWKEINKSFTLEYGEPLFFEIWDSDYGPLPDSLLGVFSVFPKPDRTMYESGILWDIDERTSISRVGLGTVKLAISQENN